MILRKTQLRAFTHYLVNGEQIVRNPRIQALIEAKLKSIPPEHFKILATPTFSGSAQTEVITWSTKEFENTPRPLNTLSDEEYKHYKEILETVLGEFKHALTTAPVKTKEIVDAAISCHSEDTIYCADDKVVITEWGMYPKNSGKENILLGMEYRVPTRTLPKQDDNPALQEGEQKPVSDFFKEEGSPDNPASKVTDESGGSDSTNNGKRGTGSGLPGSDSSRQEFPKQDTDGKGPADGGKEPPIKKRSWKPLLWLLLLLLLLLAGILSFRSCNDPMNKISKVTSPIDTSMIALGPDSVSYEVKNRVIILIKGGGSVSDFVKAFREAYPEEKYVLENPDTMIPRVVLTFPVEENNNIKESLRKKLPQFDLRVIKESIYDHTLMPNDPAMKDPDKKKQWYFDLCSVYDAWDTTMGDEDVIVAIIDDGFDLSHPELAGKIYHPYNAVEHNSNITFSDEHGTHVAATAVGNANNQTGTSGIAPKCKLMPIQIADADGNMYSSAIIDGVLYAIDQGADVVNMSLGRRFSPFVSFLSIAEQKNYIANNDLDEEEMWEEIFTLAEERNVTIVQSGGNANILVGLDPQKRSSKTIKVSAIQPDLYKADFSNFGYLSTLSAPGVDIYNAVPNNEFEFLDGTSMAAPIVTGGAALLKSQNKDITTREIINILQQTGIEPNSDVGPIVNFGNALKGKFTNAKPLNCDSISTRYLALLKELDDLKRAHPDCIADIDTLTIPVGATLDDLNGLWMSTTRLYNNSNEDLVIYFEFNGTQKGNIYIVEPDNTKYTASTSVSIDNDVVNIDQDGPATNGSKEYSAYTFVLVPDKMRQAEGEGLNKQKASNRITFKLVRIN